MSFLRQRTITESNTFLAKVFGWMFLALMLSAFSAIIFANNPEWMNMLITKNAEGKETFSFLGWVTLFAPLGFIIVLIIGLERFSDFTATGIFLLYSFINGISLSFIILAYTPGSLIGCFLGAAIMFGIMGLYGYFTKRDLTNIGSILIMALIGIIVVSIINLFMQSAMIDYIISIIGVVVFCGLTAYDVQMLKDMSYSGRKGAIIGALNLYLDFLNIFLYLLRLFGESKD